MNRVMIILLLLGLAVAGCGVGFLAYQGFNVLSPKLWITAVEGLWTRPEVMFAAALSGQDEGLVSGLLAGLLGLVWATLWLIAINLVAAIRVAILSVKALRARNGGRLKIGRDGKAVSRKKPDSVKKNRRRIELPRLRLPGRSVGVFRDQGANLEGAEKPPKKSFIEAFRAALVARRKPRSSQVVIGSGAGRKVIAEITEDTTFYPDLKDWHARIKGAPGGDPELVEEARSLQARMTKATTSKVLEDDPMNGEFLMLMAKAWAEKGQKESATSRSAERRSLSSDEAIMEQAITAVMEEGVLEDDSSEGRLDLDSEEGGFLDLDQFDDDGDEAENDPSEPGHEDMLGFDPSEDCSVELDGDDDAESAPFLELPDEDDDEGVSSGPVVHRVDGSEDGGSEGDRQVELEAAARVIFALKTMACNVAEGMEEWPEDLQNTAARVDRLEAAWMELSEIVENTDRSVISGWFRENAGASEWGWIEENVDGLSDERQAILEAIVGEEEDEEEGGEEDAEGLDDFSVTSRSFGGGDQDAHEDEVEGAEAEAPEGDDPSAASDVHARQPETEARSTSMEPTEMAGQDLSLDQLDEVEACGDLLTKWGYSARGAGAFEAKLVHTLVTKAGAKRRVAGVVHMVAGWKSNAGEQTSRLNLVFRFVPEGEWTLSTEGGIRMTDEKKNFIEVPKEVLEHPEMTSQTVVIHFHGPGVKQDLLSEVSEKVFVVSRTLSEDEIGDMIHK